MNDVLEDDLVDIWDYEPAQNIENEAVDALQQRFILLRQSFYDSYKPGEQVDETLLRNHIKKLDKAKNDALENLPESIEDLDDWLTTYLPLNTKRYRGDESMSLNTLLDDDFNIEDHSILNNLLLTSSSKREEHRGDEMISLNTHWEGDSNIEDEKTFEKVLVPRQQTLRTFVDYRPDPYRPVTETAQKMCQEIMDELKNDPENKHVVRWEDAGGGIKVIRSTLFKDKPERKGEELVLSKIEVWAKGKYPNNWEEVYSEALVKYAKIRTDHPEYHWNQIKLALNRHAVSEHRKTQAVKRVDLVPVGDEMEERVSYDSYPYEQQEWWDSLTDNNRKGFMELSDHLEKTGDDWSNIPESIKRKVRKVKARTPEQVDTKEAQTYFTDARIVEPTVAGMVDIKKKARFKAKINHPAQVKTKEMVS
ncbi:hypothetical protein RhoFasSB10_02303 [Rhodococcus fascians]|nr:hypothetical protein [Rhodococcus fascians]